MSAAARSVLRGVAPGAIKRAPRSLPVLAGAAQAAKRSGLSAAHGGLGAIALCASVGVRGSVARAPSRRRDPVTLPLLAEPGRGLASKRFRPPAGGRVTFAGAKESNQENGLPGNSIRRSAGGERACRFAIPGSSRKAAHSVVRRPTGPGIGSIVESQSRDSLRAVRYRSLVRVLRTCLVIPHEGGARSLTAAPMQVPDPGRSDGDWNAGARPATEGRSRH